MKDAAPWLLLETTRANLEKVDEQLSEAYAKGKIVFPEEVFKLIDETLDLLEKALKKEKK